MRLGPAILLIVLGSILTPSATYADVTDDLKAAVLKVISFENERPNGLPDSGDQVSESIGDLTRLINSGRLNRIGQTIAYFYRAQAKYIQNDYRISANEPVDTTVAQSALDDYEFVIRSGIMATSEANPAEAEYGAGSVELNQLHSTSAAFEYWSKCAGLNNIACMNIMADAKIAGVGGQTVDPKAAIELHEKVYATGIEQECAGAYSAQSIAEIVYFFHLKGFDDELTWMSRASTLLDKIDAELPTKDICERADFRLIEFLLRLSRGERRDDILENVTKHAKQVDARASAAYLAGALDATAFRARLAQTPFKYRRCEDYFVAYWYSMLNKQADKAQTFSDAIAEIGGADCALQLAFSHKLVAG